MILRVVMFVEQGGVRVERFAELVERIAVMFRGRRCKSREDVMELAKLFVCGLERANDSALSRERSEMVEEWV